MNLKITVTLVFIIIKSLRCSINVDSKQKPITTKNCPRQRYCKNGIHVLCKYYDQNKLFGARCEDNVSVEFTPNMIHYILKNVNYIRGKVATGGETGKDREVLPKAYGLMKLEWDKELAFSAQVLANQCLGNREAECSATDRFSNPSQSIFIIQYKYPNWENLVKRRKADKNVMKIHKGLDEIKLIFAVDSFLKFLHTSKRNVTKDIITNCPSIDELTDSNLKYYLNLINGEVTHMGCGVSAYAIRANGDAKSKQNIVQIVCNFSDGPKAKQSVYNLVLPMQGYTKRCGCPMGYRETRMCLCEKDLNLRRGLLLKNRRAAGLKQELRRSVTSSKLKDISLSRNIIIFRENRAEHLSKKKNLTYIKPGAYSQISSAPMVTRFTRRPLRRRYFEQSVTNERLTPATNTTNTKKRRPPSILKSLYSKFVATLQIYFKI